MGCVEDKLICLIQQDRWAEVLAGHGVGFCCFCTYFPVATHEKKSLLSRKRDDFFILWVENGTQLKLLGAAQCLQASAGTFPIPGGPLVDNEDGRDEDASSTVPFVTSFGAEIFIQTSSRAGKDGQWLKRKWCFWLQHQQILPREHREAPPGL